MKRKVLIVAGTGASLEFGMPSVSQIDTLFSKWSTEYYSLTDDSSKSLYTYVREQILAYYNKNPKPNLAKTINFEETLYTLLQLAAITGDDMYNNPLNAFCTISSFPSINWFKSQNKPPKGFDFQNLVSYLVDKLLEEFRDRCKRVQISNKPAFEVFSNFMKSLNEDFEIGIITTNYDNLFKQALPDIDTGFDENTGLFEPLKVYTNKNWGFCYYIHGSVHFDQVRNRHDMHAIEWRKDLNSNFNQNSSGRSSQSTREGLSIPTSVIVVGYDKANQIGRNPYRAYYSQIERFVLEAEAVLFLGYGFADLHINKCFERIRDHKKCPPIVVIDYAADDQDSMQHRADIWSYNLGSTIPFNANKMSYKDYKIPASIRELKVEKEFEVSKDLNYPLAIWYGGMVEACKNYDKIKNHLS